MNLKFIRAIITVTCKTSAPETGFESYVASDLCGRYETPYCIAPNKPQPGNNGNSFDRYCLPDGKFFSASFCGGK